MSTFSRKEKMKKILIAVPSTFVMWSHVTTDLVNLAVYSSQHFELGYINIQGALLPVSRDNLILYAKKLGFDFILFIDSDIKFPPDGLLRLYNHKKDVIGVNYAVKGEGRPVLTEDVFGDPLDKIKSSLVKMSGVGMGFTLINLKVFDGIQQPYFYIDYEYDKARNFLHWGEDKAFCRDIIKKGFSVWCDLELSDQIGHLGEFEYRLKNV